MVFIPWHKGVGTLAQALTREGEVERTFILNVIGETALPPDKIRLS